MHNQIALNRLQNLFRFDRELGELYWVNRSKGKGAGKPDVLAGCPRKKDGRWVIRVDGVLFLRSRLIFSFEYGYMPEFVEHEDRDPTNDRPGNLRPATRSQNMGNQKVSSINSTGHRGVHICRQTGRYRVRIAGKHAGRFTSLEAACAAADTLGRQVYGSFWNGG